MQDQDTIFLTEFLELINEGLPVESLYGTAEATSICEIMGVDDELMLSEGIVYKV
jgi:DNA replication licensing factor MCM3